MLSDTDRALVALAAALAAHDAGLLERAIDDAVRAAGSAAEEAILQSYLFVGFPTVLKAMAVWRSRTGRPAPAGTQDDPSEWRARGERVCELIYGAAYGRLRRNIAALHPDLERWMLEEGYGKVLGRPALPLRTRELCIAALLAAQDAPDPLYAHLRGALHAGASVADVEETLTIACAAVKPERAAAAFRTWESVRDARTRED